MTNHDLSEFSIEQLEEELHLREKGSRANLNLSLSDVPTDEIIEVVRARQLVVYGPDDRQDIFQLSNPSDINDADSVVSIFRQGDVINNGNGTSTLRTQQFATATTPNLCANEPFRNQPVGAFCSGFLVGPDLIATAGHCVDATNVTQVRFMFGFRMQNANAAVTRISNDNIYAGSTVVARQENNTTGEDWALIRTDRSVSGHRFSRIRRNGAIPNNQAVHVVGHPSGLPTKFANGANVRANTQASFFVANLDTYGGNSGSPVFNSDTHAVEGVLVRGEADFVTTANGCRISLICPNTGCRGEDCTRSTDFSAQVPMTEWLVPVLHSTFS